MTPKQRERIRVYDVHQNRINIKMDRMILVQVIYRSSVVNGQICRMWHVVDLDGNLLSRVNKKKEAIDLAINYIADGIVPKIGNVCAIPHNDGVVAVQRTEDWSLEIEHITAGGSTTAYELITHRQQINRCSKLKYWMDKFYPGLMPSYHDKENQHDGGPISDPSPVLSDIKEECQIRDCA